MRFTLTEEEEWIQRCSGGGGRRGGQAHADPPRSQVTGRPVVVKLNTGVDYKGVLACLDGYMNIAMEQVLASPTCTAPPCPRCSPPCPPRNPPPPGAKERSLSVPLLVSFFLHPFLGATRCSRPRVLCPLGLGYKPQLCFVP